MAFLAPLAGAGAAGAGLGAAATGVGAATATSALGAGLSAGTILGSGAASSGILGGLGLNALGGMASVLPASAATTAGLGALAPTAGLFAKAAPALGGLSSFAPAAATAPGVFSAAAPALGGLKAGTVIPGLTSAAPGAAGFKSLAMANAPLTANPASWSAVNQATGLGNLGTQAGNLAPEFVKTYTTTPGASTAVFDPSKGLIGNAPKIATPPTAPTTTLTSPFTEATNKSVLDAIQVSKEVPRVLPAPSQPLSALQSDAGFATNFMNLMKNPSLKGAAEYVEKHPYASAGAAYMAYNAFKPKPKQPKVDEGMVRPYEFAYSPNAAAYETSPLADSREQLYFNPTFTAHEPVKAAEGGLMGLAVGGPVETMSAMNAVGGNMMYPQAGLQTALYSNPMMQRPEAVNVLSPGEGPAVGAYSGEQKFAEGGDTKEPKTTGEYRYSYDPKTLTFTQLTAPRYADNVSKNTPPLNTGAKVSGGIASSVGGPGIAALMPQKQTQAAPLNIPAYQSPEERLGLTDFYSKMDQRLAEMSGYAAGGGVSDLGGYSDGGRLLRGPGDGVSDSIPAVIGKRQPARLADGEFVIPARIVSELGNGSTEAGARKLYAMMDRVQKARRKTVGKNRVAANTKSEKYLPA